MNKLKIDYEKACNAYLQALLKAWEFDSYYGYWISDEVGGIYEYEAELNINMGDIIYCVENDVTEAQYMEWSEYCIEAHEYGFYTPSLKAWLHGCPRTSEDTFKHLRDLKELLNKAVQEEKERLEAEEAEHEQEGGKP